MAAATAAVSASIAAAMGTSPSKSAGYGNTMLSGVMRDELNTGYLSAHDRDRGTRSPGGWLGEQPVVTMAVLKPPPLDASMLSMRPPPKSILKKRASDNAVNYSRERAAGMVTSVALASAGPGGMSSAYGGSSASTAAAAAAAESGDGLISPSAISAVSTNNGSRASSILSSMDGNVHPMVVSNMDDEEVNRIFTPPTDHRAKLVTHSPPPTHPQQHLVRKESSSPPSSEPSSSEDEEDEDDQDEEDEEVSPISPTSLSVPTIVEELEPISTPSSTSPKTGDNKIETAATTAAAATSEPYSSSVNGPEVSPDVTPGVQSNNAYTYRSLGSVNHNDNDLSQAELLNNEMISVSARAQELAKQYYGSSPGQQGGSSGGQSGKGRQQPGQEREAGQGKKRSIGFMDRIEVIPVYRKSEYNRQSDKHATFRILTSDLKTEIRDELNTYKMREMAVHVDSMCNTAFH
ncbi:hypothetical protein EDD21DRAFT_375444 [Dissophora ornata]|nr:hypothetical protein EDD21DRAFT_375444 [Dissophora ornata]